MVVAWSARTFETVGKHVSIGVNGEMQARASRDIKHHSNVRFYHAFEQEIDLLILDRQQQRPCPEPPLHHEIIQK